MALTDTRFVLNAIGLRNAFSRTEGPLAKALLKSEWLFGFIEPELGIIGVDAAQTTAGERFLRYLRLAFDKLEIQPLRYTQPVEDLLVQFARGDGPAAAPDGP